MIKISPSILSADFARLGEEVQAVEQAGADYIHVDVMDGHFVPNLTIGAPVVKSLRPITSLPLDVHLMIENPDRYIPDFAAAGADIITVHQEAAIHLHRTIQLIHSLGKRAGVSLNPATPVGLLELILGEVDLILLMTVNPGFGGQSFIPFTLGKIAQMRTMIERSGRAIELEVDGGVKTDNIGELAAAGADVFVAGSAVFDGGDYAGKLAELRAAAG
ncbi:MAG: ribulose-phosphate 3-epimerase [Desulfuromonadaceae bacterium]|nr:ribulose-phosphate 3-epimerase [Desulfuromonadaceae bacterium]